MEPSHHVAVVGLGLMGGPIAGHLAASGITTHGWDVDANAMRRAQDKGVRPLASVQALPPGIETVFTSLPSAAALHEVVEALLAGACRPRVVAELSTLSLADKQQARGRLEAHAVQMLDAPISGTGAQALTRDLGVYASGPASAWQRARKAIGCFALRPRYVGDFGNGTRLKLVANLLVAIHNVASAEAMAVAEASGLDLADVIDVIRDGAGNSRIFELRAPLMAQARYEPATMKLEVWAKDMALIGGFVQELGIRTPVFDATRPVYDSARAWCARADTAGVFEALRAQGRAR